jgi:diguanylate cyclase (GGDEF)-like protein
VKDGRRQPQTVKRQVQGDILAETESSQLFSFEVGEADSMETPPMAELEGPNPDDLHKALIAAGDAAYRWNILTDQISWSSNAAEILGCPVSYISTGKQYAQLLDLDNFSTRYDTVMNSLTTDAGSGVPFQIEYVFRSEGRSRPKTIWIEDQGRWFMGPNGKAKEVYGTVRRIDERHKREQRLNFLGNCDPLTGMMNRGRLTEALSEAISVAVRENGQCAFAIASVQNLNVVNDAYGFEVADEVIVALGRKLRQVMRAGDAIARFSGGKFGFILNNCGEIDLKIALERLLETVRDSVIETDHGPVWAMLSIGAVCLPEFATNAIAATSLAEEALSEASKLPSDGYVLHKPSERRQSVRKLNARCAAEIVTCLKEERFKLAFQPIISATTGETILHEALLRMAEGGGSELIAASHLVPIAEQLGLIRLVDRSVTQLILQTLHQYPSARLSMNISGTTAMDPRWHNQLLETISASKLAENRLVVEITETVAINDLASTRRFVERLREAGCGVAIDDFGAGFTSFKNLRELPISMVKIDGAYCRDLAANRENAFIVRNLIDLGRNFNLTTVAEWIETEEDAALLKSWGVDYLQGNLIAEASIDIPWPKAAVPTFDLEGDQTGEIASAPNFSAVMEHSSAPKFQIRQSYAVRPISDPPAKPVASETAVAPADQIADVKLETAATEIEQIDLSVHAAMATVVELEFSDIDASIASLKATMAQFPTVETSLEVDKDRSAA